MTNIETIYLEALKDANKRSDFYTAFLHFSFFIPTAGGDGNDAIKPLIVEAKGYNYLMLFDTEERLAAWAKQPIPYVVVPCHAIMEAMPGGLNWVLFAGTGHTKTFAPDEIKMLREELHRMKQRQTERVEPPQGSCVLVGVGAPAEVPDGLLGSLQKKIATFSQVKSAYLGQVLFSGNGEKPHLAMVVDFNKKDPRVMECICRDLGLFARKFIGANTLDIMPNEGTGLPLEITKAVAPFYTKNLSAATRL